MGGLVLNRIIRVRGVEAVKHEFVGKSPRRLSCEGCASERGAGGLLVAGSYAGCCSGDELSPVPSRCSLVATTLARVSVDCVGRGAGAIVPVWAAASGCGCVWVCSCPLLIVPCRAGVLVSMGLPGLIVVGGG